MPNHIIFLAGILLCIIWGGCQKSASDEVDKVAIADSLKKPTYKIELLGGLNQSDTAGHQLKNDIKLKVYKNGLPFASSRVKYIGTGCTGQYTDGQYVVDSGPTAGESNYRWSLSEIPGVQTLRIILCDLKNNPLDSVQITATAIAPAGNGFHVSACSTGAEVDRAKVIFCKLKSGRIISLYSGAADDYMYSDDNGLSWRNKTPVKLVFPRKIVAAPNGDVYMLADAIVNDYIYRSKDEGDTWQEVFKSDINEELEDIGFAPEGKIVCTTRGTKVLVSANEGKTWQRDNVYPIRANIAASYITTTASGKIFMIGNQGSIYQSVDFGITWTVLKESQLFEPFESYGLGAITSIYKDNKEDVYIGRTFPVPGIYKLNAGYTAAKRLNFGDDIFENFKGILKISLQKDGYYYFYIMLKGLYRTKEFVTYEDLSKKYKLDVIDYIVADNNNLIVANGQYGKIYYLKQ